MKILIIYGAKKPSERDLKLIEKFQESLVERFETRKLRFRVLHSSNKSVIWSTIKEFNPTAIIVSGISPIFGEREYGDIVNLPILTDWKEPYNNILLLPIYSFSYLLQVNSLIGKTINNISSELDSLLRGNTSSFKKLEKV